jgi:N-acylneuraminate cytidylyltransferase
MSTICLIPARGGSKRIPRKNVKIFGGKPIIAWSIDAALKAGCFDDVVVSTDDCEIQDIARAHGASVPFTRPEALANDFASTLDVVVHAIEWYIEEGRPIDHVCILYATSPFVTAGDLRKANELLSTMSEGYVVSVCEYAAPIQRSLQINSNGRIEMLYPEHSQTRSQDLPKAYHDAGQFYFGAAASFCARKPLLGPAALPLILPISHVQDIDTPEDWEYAEIMFKTMNIASEK